MDANAQERPAGLAVNARSENAAVTISINADTLPYSGNATDTIRVQRVSDMSIHASTGSRGPLKILAIIRQNVLHQHPSAGRNPPSSSYRSIR